MKAIEKYFSFTLLYLWSGDDVRDSLLDSLTFHVVSSHDCQSQICWLRPNLNHAMTAASCLQTTLIQRKESINIQKIFWLSETFLSRNSNFSSLNFKWNFVCWSTWDLWRQTVEICFQNQPTFQSKQVTFSISTMWWRTLLH